MPPNVDQTADRMATTAIRASARVLNRVGRAATWPLRRFFDPRFTGLAEAERVTLERLEAVRAETRAQNRFLIDQLAATRADGQARALGSREQHEATRRLVEDLSRQIVDLRTTMLEELSRLQEIVDNSAEHVRSSSLDGGEIEVPRRSKTA